MTNLSHTSQMGPQPKTSRPPVNAFAKRLFSISSRRRHSAGLPRSAPILRAEDAFHARGSAPIRRIASRIRHAFLPLLSGLVTAICYRLLPADALKAPLIDFCVVVVVFFC